MVQILLTVLICLPHSSNLCSLQVRALWYVVEVAVKEGGCKTGDGFITIVWDKHTTIWDYDSNVHDKMVYLCRNCWPIKTMPTHICCAPKILVKILKPIINAVLDKEARMRLLMHNVPESEIPEVLTRYGIFKDMLPTEMGGTIRLDHSEWIANRRAVEMEEII